MTKSPVPFRGGTRRALSLFFVLLGYAVAGFGAVLMIDGGVRALSVASQEGILVDSRTVNVEFAIPVFLIVAGVAVFVLGWGMAALASRRKGVFD